MQTKAKRKTYNILMVAVIVLIIASGVMVTGHLKGWFGGSSGGGAGGDAVLVCAKTTGVVQVERSGVGYTLKDGTVMQDGDIVATKNASEAVLTWQDANTLALNEKGECTITSCSDEGISLQLTEGELFADMREAEVPVSIALCDDQATVTGGVFSVSEQSGAGTVCVYEGAADIQTAAGESLSVAAGEQILLTENEKGEQVADITKMEASSLSPYTIEKLLAVEGGGLCFTAEDLQKVVADREAQKAEADKALEQASIRIADGETADGDAADGSGQTADGQSGTAASGSTSGSSSSGSGSSGGSAGQQTKTCTITISCASILDNMGNLAAGKDRYVPSSGIILGTTAVEFREGETAYDVTRRACDAMGIQMEAAYVPLYGSYYVEGINNLYEFDCGGMSGWLYFVNGWSPNYGCSEYVLKDGDSIVWEYTCSDD